MAGKNADREATARDTQQLRVYRAEKMAQHLLLGNYWTQSMTEIAVLDLIEAALNHPGVDARWKPPSVTVSFPEKGTTAWSERGTGRINLPPGTRNPLIVLHEVAHLLPPAKTENSQHGPGFVAIYRYLVRVVLGDDTARVLEAAFSALRVKADDAMIPPARIPSGSSWRRGEDVPGVMPAAAANAAEVLKLAAHAGVFGGPGDPLRQSAFTISRRLHALTTGNRDDLKPPARIPETVTVPVSSLLRANSRDDVAEIVLGAVRKDMFPAQLKPPPLPKKKKRSKQTVRVERSAATKAKASPQRKTAKPAAP